YGYGHGANAAIIGGIVYRGTNIPELIGAYLFAEFITGDIWALRYDGTNVQVQNLMWNGAPLKEIGIVAFGSDPRNGDVLVADFDNNIIRRLAFTPSPTGPVLPGTLTQSGIFANVRNRTPQTGVIPYDVN